MGLMEMQVLDSLGLMDDPHWIESRVELLGGIANYLYARDQGWYYWQLLQQN